MKSETPIAVIRSVSREARRTGRYAKRSMTIPAIAHATIAPAITMSAERSEGSSPRSLRERK
jgi:hypothetical protein